VKRIDCPWCGVRDDNEFTWGGEAHIARPDATCSDEEWRDYLFMRRNPRGTHHERWCHTYGCGRWFHLARDTMTHRIVRAYPIEQGPIEQGPTDATD
jgi:sarcosine oxidase subunit delta